MFAARGGGAYNARDLLAQRVATSLTAWTAMPALTLVLVFALIVPRRAGTTAPLVADAAGEGPAPLRRTIQEETR